MGHVLPFLSTSCILISGVLVALGWRHILKKRREAHQETMVLGAAFATLFFILYLSKTVFVGNTLFGGPEELKPAYYGFLLFHTVLATVGAVFGISTLVLAYRKSFGKHRKLGRVTATIWLFTVATGVVVYIMLYVMYPGGETAGLIDALTGA